MQALLIIDMQGFVTDRIANGMDYYPKDSIDNMRTVIHAFRAAGKPVLHVRHQTLAPDSPLHSSSPHFLPVAGFTEQSDEPVLIKHTSSAFSSTDLYQRLQRDNINEVVVIGAVAGFCVNSTIRAGSDLGLAMSVVRDAVLSFPLDGDGLDAKAIYTVTLGLLEAGFARGVQAADLTP
ncbi:isochorismatase family protein [Kluyvera cryocrescens]|uniref:isochorismatase family protein n=1 Tax=Kluyvera cryocrescens TaxID=580 RepID=UPI000D93A85F|nr:isochorismatase family protein [Kluyvera cryocrescens]SQC35621.1 Isochorismatase family protein yecD [Kluyvera cryocrescens]